MEIAIFELIALFLTLPVSYLLAYYFRNHSKPGYKDELQRLFTKNWNGNSEDELYAWLRVKRLIPNTPGNSKRHSYIDKKLGELNKNNLYGSVKVNQYGEFIDKDENQITELM